MRNNVVTPDLNRKALITLSHTHHGGPPPSVSTHTNTGYEVNLLSAVSFVYGSQLDNKVHDIVHVRTMSYSATCLIFNCKNTH